MVFHFDPHPCVKTKIWGRIFLARWEVHNFSVAAVDSFLRPAMRMAPFRWVFIRTILSTNGFLFSMGFYSKESNFWYCFFSWELPFTRNISYRLLIMPMTMAMMRMRMRMMGMMRMRRMRMMIMISDWTRVQRQRFLYTGSMPSNTTVAMEAALMAEMYGVQERELVTHPTVIARLRVSVVCWNLCYAYWILLILFGHPSQRFWTLCILCLMALQCFAPSMYFQHCHYFLAQPQTGAFHFAPCSVGGAWQISWSNSTWQCANKGHLCALECLAWNWTQRHFAILLVVKMQPVHMELVNPLRMWREECAGVVQVCLWAVSLRPCWKWRIASLTMECRWGVPACARNPRHIPVTASDTIETASSSLTASLTASPVNTPLILDHLDIENHRNSSRIASCIL